MSRTDILSVCIPNCLARSGRCALSHSNQPRSAASGNYLNSGREAAELLEQGLRVLDALPGYPCELLGELAAVAGSRAVSFPRREIPHDDGCHQRDDSEY